MRNAALRVPGDAVKIEEISFDNLLLATKAPRSVPKPVFTDAEAACVVMRRSIAELCAADHRDDPKILAQWLANKRPDIMRGWMTRAGNSVLVAIEGDSATLLSRQRLCRNRRAARRSRRADRHSAINLARVRPDDFGVAALGQLERELRLARARRPGDDQDARTV